MRKRHILYDYDEDMIISRRIYDDYGEAVADADELGNVIVLDLDWDDGVDPKEYEVPGDPEGVPL